MKNLNSIAKFSTTTNTWSALPNNGLINDSGSGSSGSFVNALAAVGSDLYVGGRFNHTFDGGVTNLNNIARFRTTGNTWSALNKGLNGDVYAFAVSGSDLYVGGNFTYEKASCRAMRSLPPTGRG